MLTATIQTDEGDFVAEYSERGLCALHFPGHRLPPPGRLPEPAAHWHYLTTQAVGELLAGMPVSKLPPLDLSDGTPFQQRVWQALCRIPAGQTRSYGQIATALHKPGGARAVGAACGANPIPLLVPCHRVVGSHGQMGGFSGGLRWKEFLLERESARNE